ncbi:pirin family protein [Thalassolituus sp. LLYu03]|uniref:pirin family protein n=1 Tax=Thalassolituus sp. LLYu03 TaxID=3421656 RepID=UPI003D2E76C5
MKIRELQSIIPSQATSDGDGVRIRRVAMFNQPVTDPFLMIDELSSDNPDDFIGGFPPHPHRGMETLTYLRHGSLEHRDHLGNRGMINSGGAQWMSAGRGIIHSEMPAREMKQLHGFQLWINLPAAEKMQAPKYRDVPASDIPKTCGNGWQASVIAGEWTIEGQATAGPLLDLAAGAAYLDLELEAGASVSIATPHDETVVALMYDGLLQTTPMAPAKSLLVFGKGDTLLLAAKTSTRAILLRGTPLREPVVHYGPFVMNTAEEIRQAIEDYNRGDFGRS